MRGPSGSRAAAAGIAVLLVPLATLAADPTLEVRLDRQRFGVEDTVRLIVKVYDAPDRVANPQLSGLDNLQVVAGPSIGNEFRFVNGIATSARSFSYVLRPSGVGTASVGEVVVAVGDTELRSQPISAEVVPGSVDPPPRARRAPFGFDPFADPRAHRAQPAPRIFLRHLVSATKVVLGEAVTATVVLDTTSAIDDFDWLTTPSYPGWWAQRVDPPEQIRPEPAQVDGVHYNRFVVSRSALVPLKSGQLALPAVQARLAVRTRSFFDPVQVVELSSETLDIEVSERPPAPPDFSGAVGDLAYSATVEPDAIDFGSSAVLSVRLKGTGNLPLVEPPSTWPSCEGCDTYPPEEESRIDVDAAGIHGSRTWKMTVVPRRSGELTMEPVTLAVFDPTTGSYRRQTVGPFELTVASPPATPTPVVPVVAADAGGPRGPGYSDLPSDVHRPVPSWTWLLAALAAGAVVGGAVVWAVGRRRRPALPRRRPGQSPAERARELQSALERWWLEVRSRHQGSDELRREMERLRSDLEAVRFAPGRADHSETVLELEERLRNLQRNA